MASCDKCWRFCFSFSFSLERFHCAFSLFYTFSLRRSRRRIGGGQGGGPFLPTYCIPGTVKEVAQPASKQMRDSILIWLGLLLTALYKHTKPQLSSYLK